MTRARPCECLSIAICRLSRPRAVSIRCRPRHPARPDTSQRHFHDELVPRCHTAVARGSGGVCRRCRVSSARIDLARFPHRARALRLAEPLGSMARDCAKHPESRNRRKCEAGNRAEGFEIATRRRFMIVRPVNGTSGPHYDQTSLRDRRDGFGNDEELGGPGAASAVVVV